METDLHRLDHMNPVSTERAFMSRRHLPILLAIILISVISGCTRKSVEGSVTTVQYETWVGIACMIGGVAGTAISFLLRSKGGRAWAFLVISALATILFLPFGFVDYVRVSQDHLETRWGFWCFPTRHSIAFDEVRGVQLTKKVKVGRRGRSDTSYNLEFQMSDGRTESLSATNDLVEASVHEILQPLADRGITLVDLTGE